MEEQWWPCWLHLPELQGVVWVGGHLVAELWIRWFFDVALKRDRSPSAGYNNPCPVRNCRYHEVYLMLQLFKAGIAEALAD